MKKRKSIKTNKKVDTIPTNTKLSESGWGKFSDGFIKTEIDPFIEDGVAYIVPDTTPKISIYSHDKLIEALYWIYDAFDRANMGYVFVYSTAESIIKQRDLEGDGIHVGVRKLEWITGSKDIFDAFAGIPEKYSLQLDTYVLHYGDIPIYLHVFEDDPCITSPNQIQYHNEFVKVPNPYSRFEEVYGNSNHHA